MQELAITVPSNLGEVNLRLSDYENFVRKAGEADPQHLKTAKCLVSFFSDGLAGTAALKSAKGYRQTVFSKAGVKKLAERFPFELGYIVVRSDLRGRGISHMLTAAALSQREGHGVYATSNLSNLGMHSVLLSRRFVRAGIPWESTKKPGEYLALFLSTD
jgi:hypothetical protein